MAYQYKTGKLNNKGNKDKRSNHTSPMRLSLLGYENCNCADPCYYVWSKVSDNKRTCIGLLVFAGYTAGVAYLPWSIAMWILLSPFMVLAGFACLIVVGSIIGEVHADYTRFHQDRVRQARVRREQSIPSNTKTYSRAVRAARRSRAHYASAAAV